MIDICTCAGDDLSHIFLFPLSNLLYILLMIFVLGFRLSVEFWYIHCSFFGVIYKRESSSKPPSYNEEPEHNDEKNNIPQPTAALLRSHVVHSSKSSRED